MGWTFLVLIPKGKTDIRGILLLETLWKLVELIIDTRLRSRLQFRNVLHGFRAGRGTWMAIMELKIMQEPSCVYHDPIFLLFLDFHKAYNTVYRNRLLQTLEVYAGPRMYVLLETFCDYQQVVPRQNRYHGPALPDTWGTTHGDLVSLTLFNVVVDNVIRTWLAMTVEDHRVAHDGLG